MITYTWVRGYTSGTGLQVAFEQLAAIPRGGVLKRLHYGWRCTAITSTLYSAPDIMDTDIAVGALTGYPAGSYTPPNALTSPDDVAPPVQRYIWWEVRKLRPVTWGANEDDVVTWEDSGPIEHTDTHSQVTASVPAGDSLGVYLSWAPNRTDFPSAGYISVAMWWSLLYST